MELANYSITNSLLSIHDYRLGAGYLKNECKFLFSLNFVIFII
jgi:hypothetical protein